ncbi:MAG: prepilin-type N-terminal cleavage/methylation domain-containing protein [Candidatus Omnitrophica bacterium]|nr:prepilin-type N-terminal cleavage/methylation domain-containing protein [Candidatus Omnitrophota bacterium]
MPKRIYAFTLIELIITVAIVLILAGFALVKYSNVIEKARSAEAYAVLADIAAAENGYYVEYNTYTNVWANLDRYSSAPVSQNFDFSSALSSLGSGYVQATHVIGTLDYYMCIKGGGKGTTAPSCP